MAEPPELTPFRSPEPFADASVRRLHLVAGLESAWIPKPREEPGFRRLESWLACHPEICLTLVCDADFEMAMSWIGWHLDILPHHLVSSGGLAIHHFHGERSWESDSAFTEWLELQKHARNTGGKPLSFLPVAIEYLEIQWAAPRPLVVYGAPSSERDLLVLADIPVPTGGAPGELEPFATRISPSLGCKVGRKGLLELLRSTSVPKTSSN